MRFRLVFGLFALVMMIAACQGPPPTVIYIVVSPTPSTTDGAATEDVTPAPTLITEEPSATTLPEASQTPSAAPSVSPTPAQTTPEPTALPANFPTPLVRPIQVAEQLFENGRMFWLQPTGQIWVLKITTEGRGTWEIYEDTFVEGEEESDPSLVPPEGRYQPERGFGKLWREAGNLREELGWGVTPEFGYVSSYEYHAGGSVDENGEYVAGPGYHVLYSLGGEQFRFNEADSTWQLGGG